MKDNDYWETVIVEWCTTMLLLPSIIQLPGAQQELVWAPGIMDPLHNK